MLLRVVVAALLVTSLLAGCTDKLGLQSASVENPGFQLEPETGGKDTRFRVDAGKLGDKNVTWQWGDGLVSYGKSAEHVYNFTNGVMTVTMLVTDESGKQGIATRTITLGTGKNADPTVTASATKKWVEVGKPVNLTARGNDRDRDPLTYLWTYRVLEGGVASDGHAHSHGGSAPSQDGEMLIEGNGAKTQAIFDAPGKYAVKVRAKDPKGGEATGEVVIDVSKRIPDPIQEVTFSGTLAVGTGGAASVSEALWATPAPDTFVDAGRHLYTLKYPATTVVLLVWNDTSTQMLWDLDLELRDASGKTVFHQQTRAPSPAIEFNFTEQEPGDYTVIVRNIAGAQTTYDLVVRSALRLTPELVAVTEG